MKLFELDIKERDKKVIAFCYCPRSVGEISAKLELSIDYLRKDILPFLVEKEYLEKITTLANKVYYKIGKNVYI